MGQRLISRAQRDAADSLPRSGGDAAASCARTGERRARNRLSRTGGAVDSGSRDEFDGPVAERGCANRWETFRDRIWGGEGPAEVRRAHVDKISTMRPHGALVSAEAGGAA